MELQWPLILFTTFIAWSAGLFGAQSVLALRGEGAKAQMTALITSVVLMAVGGIAVFFHLEHWERIFNGFGHITSGITQELIAIVVLFAIMVVFFVYLRRGGEQAKVPQWLAVAGIVMAVVLVAVMGHSYMMASRPAWNSVLQIGSLLGAACALGPATMVVLCELKGDASALGGTVNVAGQIANAVLTVAYVAAAALAGSAFTKVGYWFDPVSPTQKIVDPTTLSPFSGDSMLFTVLALAGVIVAVVAAFMGKKQGNGKLWGSVAVVAAAVGAVSLRIMFYQLGVSVYPFF